MIKLPYIIRRPDLDTVYQFRCTLYYIAVFFGILVVLDLIT